jgi:hypothetical protein
MPIIDAVKRFWGALPPTARDLTVEVGAELIANKAIRNRRSSEEKPDDTPSVRWRKRTARSAFRKYMQHALLTMQPSTDKDELVKRLREAYAKGLEDDLVEAIGVGAPTPPEPDGKWWENEKFIADLQEYLRKWNHATYEEFLALWEIGEEDPFEQAATRFAKSSKWDGPTKFLENLADRIRP